MPAPGKQEWGQPNGRSFRLTAIALVIKINYVHALHSCGPKLWWYYDIMMQRGLRLVYWQSDPRLTETISGLVSNLLELSQFVFWCGFSGFDELFKIYNANILIIKLFESNHFGPMQSSLNTVQWTALRILPRLPNDTLLFWRDPASPILLIWSLI